MRGFIIVGVILSIQLLSVDCSNTTECGLVMDGEEHRSLMLTNVSESQEITVTGRGSCVLTLLLVGGGGQDVSGTDNGGGGSGYLEYRSFQVSPGTALIAQVGRGGEYYGQEAQASSVSFSSGDTLTALPGQDNVGRDDVGAGYSGNNTISGVIISYQATQEAVAVAVGTTLMAVPEEPMGGMERMVVVGMEAVELVKTSRSTPSDPGS